MGTRSIVAIPTGLDTFRGRYIHWDGYPSGVGVALQSIVTRDGYTTAVRTLAEEHYGWSSLDQRQDPSAVLGPGYTDGRFVNVPGYGVAYTTHAGQSSPDEWVTSDGDDWGTEWAYVLGESSMTVYSRAYTDTGQAHWNRNGIVRYADADGMTRVDF